MYWSIASLVFVLGTANSFCRVRSRVPHDTVAFTQGLFESRGTLFESTGLYGKSQLRAIDLPSGRVLRTRDLPNDRFGEGVTILASRLYQLTWRSQVAYVYDPDTFALLDSLSISGETWGLTDDGSQLIASDGSATLRWIDPATGRVTLALMVTAGDREVRGLNELEFVDGEILANKLPTDTIVRINPSTGTVLGWIVPTTLFQVPWRPTNTSHPLNGIAYDPRQRDIILTGKNWPWIYVLQDCL